MKDPYDTSKDVTPTELVSRVFELEYRVKVLEEAVETLRVLLKIKNLGES